MKNAKIVEINENLKCLYNLDDIKNLKYEHSLKTLKIYLN